MYKRQRGEYMAKDKKKEESKGIALVLLGIVAVIAIVGLVLLFSKATSVGQVARNSGYADYAVGLGPEAYQQVAPFRAGELAQPAQWIKDTNAQAASGAEEEAPVQSLVVQRRKS